MAGLSSCKNKSAKPSNDFLGLPLRLSGQRVDGVGSRRLVQRLARLHRLHQEVRVVDRLAVARQLDAPQPGEIDGAAQRILQRAVGVVQRRRFARGPRALVGRTGDEAVGMPLPLKREIGPIERRGLQLERRRQSQPRKMIHDRLQTWKDSPQPQRPFSFGFLNTKPDFSFSSS